MVNPLRLPFSLMLTYHFSGPLATRLVRLKTYFAAWPARKVGKGLKFDSYLSEWLFMVAAWIRSRLG